MTEERLALAIRRLDRALARVEAASNRIADQSGAGGETLKLRHEKLRSRAAEAIRAIDRLTGAA